MLRQSRGRHSYRAREGVRQAEVLSYIYGTGREQGGLTVTDDRQRPSPPLVSWSQGLMGHSHHLFEVNFLTMISSGSVWSEPGMVSPVSWLPSLTYHFPSWSEPFVTIPCALEGIYKACKDTTLSLASSPDSCLQQWALSQGLGGNGLTN